MIWISLDASKAQVEVYGSKGFGSLGQTNEKLKPRLAKVPNGLDQSSPVWIILTGKGNSVV